ncbi:hypothetical protein KW782_01640 [Candidatus Parcubacteria bacterium]|nr:hypothetical protein [Candidatus Parcubacteria bacterium]
MNQKRYWLRGGISMIILVIVLFIYILLSFRFPFTAGGGELSGPPGLSSALYMGYVMVGIPVLAVAFGIGSFLGWLYGKIKK